MGLLGGKMSCRTDGCKKMALMVAMVAMLVLAVPAFAGNCLQDEYSLTARQTLNCTANDVRVAKVINVRDPNTGLPITTCTPGTFTFLADFLVQRHLRLRDQISGSTEGPHRYERVNRNVFG